jgi:hypothetical protein
MPYMVSSDFLLAVSKILSETWGLSIFTGKKYTLLDGLKIGRIKLKLESI